MQQQKLQPKPKQTQLVNIVNRKDEAVPNARILRADIIPTVDINIISKLAITVSYGREDAVMTVVRRKKAPGTGGAMVMLAILIALHALIITRMIMVMTLLSS